MENNLIPNFERLFIEQDDEQLKLPAEIEFSFREEQRMVLEYSRADGNVENCLYKDLSQQRTFNTDFFREILQLGLNETQINGVFHSSKKLIENTHHFVHGIVNTQKCHPLEAVDASFKLVQNELVKLDSSYKRQKFFENDPGYIKPVSIAIGTHWETYRDKNSKIKLPAHVQSKFAYISPLEILKSLFSDKDFYDFYFDYNENRKHACIENVYKDYCCGSVFKKIDLFANHPDSLQLQFYIDGVELCDAAKTKKNKHGQVLLYMSIRNLPTELAYNLNNIHRVALINESDLKKTETDYTNLLEVLFKDIQILETSGLSLNEHKKLRGQYATSKLE